MSVYVRSFLEAQENENIVEKNLQPLLVTPLPDLDMASSKMSL